MWTQKVAQHSSSTQDDLKNMILSNPQLGEGICLRALSQSAGRGRHGRAWLAQEGDLIVSFALEPKRPIIEWGSLGLVVGAALAKVASNYILPLLKWPNDLLIENKKCAGILCEVFDDMLIVGLGVNCMPRVDASDFSVLPVGDVDDFFMQFLNEFECLYKRWNEQGFVSVKEDWLAYALDEGSAITVKKGKNIIKGYFAGISDDGSLLLAGDNDAISVISSGELLM